MSSRRRLPPLITLIIDMTEITRQPTLTINAIAFNITLCPPHMRPNRIFDNYYTIKKKKPRFQKKTFAFTACILIDDVIYYSLSLIDGL